MRGWPSGVVVKFAHSALARVRTPASPDRPSMLIKPHCGSIPHKIEKDLYIGWLSNNLPQAKKEEADWQQMLAQGQSSSHKKNNNSK